MHKLLLLALLVPLMAIAKGTVVTATGGAPIPTSFSASDAHSQVMECQGNVLEVINYPEVPLAVGFGTSTTAPAFDYAYVPTGSGGVGRFKPKGGMSGGQYVYIRAAGGATATSDSVFVSCYYEEKP